MTRFQCLEETCNLRKISQHGSCVSVLKKKYLWPRVIKAFVAGIIKSNDPGRFKAMLWSIVCIVYFTDLDMNLGEIPQPSRVSKQRAYATVRYQRSEI